MNTTDLCAVLGRTRNTIDDVVATLDAVGAALPPTDGAACFNLLYLVTTQHVRGALQGARFEDPAFMDRLDVVFAGLYLDALRRALVGEPGVPRAWDALFERRAAGCMPLRFALAGMNAHINYDLARAVVMTTAELGGDVASGSPRHRDFEKINDVLCETEAVVKERFLTGALCVLDGVCGQVDDRAALWSIRAAREGAWSQALVRWSVRGTPLEAPLDVTLDRSAGLTARCLLV